MSGDEQKEIAVDQLAEMTALGFKDMQERMALLTTREEFAQLKSEVIENLKASEDRIGNRLDRFLHTIREDHEVRLSRVEEKAHELEGQL